jgi:hypothetical protein
MIIVFVSLELFNAKQSFASYFDVGVERLFFGVRNSYVLSFPE